MKKKIYFLFFLILNLIVTSFFIYGLGISSNSGDFLRRFDYEPNKKYVFDYELIANDGYLADYEFFVESKSKVDLRQYVIIEPNTFKDVPAGETRKFKVLINLPNNLDSPGENEIIVFLRDIAKDTYGGLVARPVVGLRYLIYVLYPWKAVEWTISLPPMNLNDKQDFNINVKNIGVPTIEKAYADIYVYNIDNQQIRQLRTNEIYNLKSKEEKSLTTSFDANGLLSGEYYAIAYLNYDGNISNQTYYFRIGQKNVKILNFTKLIEYRSINKFDIEVESEWNKEINNIYAIVDVYTEDKKTKLTNFRSFDTNLGRLEKKTLESYLDARNFDKGKYKIVITLNYEGSTSSLEDFIIIDENINKNVVEEIPGTFSMKKFVSNIISNITLVNVLVFLLIIFVLLSLYLVYTIFKSKSIEKENISKSFVNSSNFDDLLFDEETLNKIRDLQKLFSNEEIKEKLIKKGWNPAKVDKLFNYLNKNK
ncbi:MAG: hypothetical protein QXE31_03235 [Candidatus Woesearchaeota archaeon]